MSRKIHQPGRPLKKSPFAGVKKVKSSKAHKKSQGKDWFGSAPGIKDAEHM